MRAIAHSPSFAKKVGVKQSVGKDFEMADKKMKKFGSGGVTKQMPTADDMGSLNMAKGGGAKAKLKAKGKAMAAAMIKDRIGRALAARGAEAPMPPAPSAPMAPAAPAGGAPAMKKGGKPKKYAKGGGIERKGGTKVKMVKMAKGGSIDGIAQRGKTRCAGAK